jgi:hypothetical protein
MDDFGPGSGAPDQNEGNAPGPTTNPSDGHTYDLQKSPNESGLDWFTVDSFNNSTDAVAAYDTAVKNGGLWQLLRDGQIYDTNLPVDQRYDATQKKKDEEGLKHEYSCEYLLNGEWSWFATATTLEEAKSIVKSAQEGTAYATISYGKYQIRDWNGEVVWSQTIDTPKPGDTDTTSPSTTTQFSGDYKGIVLLVAAVGIGLFLLYMLKGAKHAPN